MFEPGLRVFFFGLAIGYLAGVISAIALFVIAPPRKGLPAIHYDRSDIQKFRG